MKPYLTPKFGVAGNPPNFWISKFNKERLNAPEWLHSLGLDALEIQCTRGLRMSDERAAAFREKAATFGITISIHGPYYISIGTSEPSKVANSLNELKKCVHLAKQIGSTRIVFHPGAVPEDRVTALKNAIKTLRQFEKEVDVCDVKLLPEVAGKIRSLGSLEEILEICGEIECAWPCLDLAHLHARTHGSLRTKEDVHSVLDKIEKKLGRRALQKTHIHMYPIRWGPKGEIKHRAFHDKVAAIDDGRLFASDLLEDKPLPRHEPLLDELFERRLSPVIICEAHNTQDVGAIEMKKYWQSLVKTTPVFDTTAQLHRHII